jgi:hypothetical protein
MKAYLVAKITNIADKFLYEVPAGRQNVQVALILPVVSGA